MKLTELRNLEIGTEVRLKGTNAIFEVRKIDQLDDFRPVYLRLVRSDKPVITKLYVGGDHTILYPCKSREEAWIFLTTKNKCAKMSVIIEASSRKRVRAIM